MLLTGIGVFLVGIIKFSNLLQAGSNERVKQMFEKMGENRMVGFGVGTGATVFVQSSTATTVIVVGLVNAGMMTLTQSTAVIFGANLGTALSNILLSFSAFRIKYFFMALVFVGATTKMVTKNKRANKIADILMSFGIIFVGLEIMSSTFSGNVYLRDAFSSMFEAVSFPLLLVLLGLLLTAIMQSSTAATAVFISLAANNVIGLTSIIYLVIGTRLGTTVTTLIAAIPANKNAKRAAMIHFLFNLFGTILFLAIVWPFENAIVGWFEGLIVDPIWQITVFGLIFSLVTAAVLLVFIKPMNSLVFWIIKDKPEQITIEEVAPQMVEEGEQDTFQGFTDKF